MNEWIIESYTKGEWKKVCRAFDLRRGFKDNRRHLRPTSLDECIAILSKWYACITSGNSFYDDSGVKPPDWTYRIKNVNTGEAIPGDLFK